MVLCVFFVSSLVLSGCGGNHLGIPNGDYFVVDAHGNPTGQVVYTIKGDRVSTHRDYGHLTDFNPSGRIKKPSGGQIYNYAHFEFSYKTNTALFGAQTAHLRLEISFDKETGILVVEDGQYVRGTSGGGPSLHGV